MMSKEAQEQLKRWAQVLSTVAVLTDIDGTLAPIVPTPDLSEVPKELRELLRYLSGRCRIVAAISGRPAEEASQLIGLKDIVYYGNHGFEVLRGGEVDVIPEATPYQAAIEELQEKAREALGPLGAFIEEKGITASIHYRNVSSEVGEQCKAFVKCEGERLGLKVTVGRGVVEVRPPVRADKGTSVRRLIEEYSPERALFIGDDTTDLDAFQELEALREEGVLTETLRIGVNSDEGPSEITSESDLIVDGVEGVEEVLRMLAQDG